MSGTKKYLLSAAAVAAAVGILIRPAALSAVVRDSVAGCLEVVIPALFAFTVLAVYLQRSGLYLTALKPAAVPLSKLLGISEELCAVFLLANIGGYPVGAKLLSGLVESGRLSRRDAGRMLSCCYGSGPSFVIGTAGMQVFGSAAAGGIIYAACFLSSLAVAVVVCRTGEKITLCDGGSRTDLGTDCFILSVDSGARVMYTVCIMAAAFSAVTALLQECGVSGAVAWLFGAAGAGDNSDRIFPALLEVTRVRDMLPAGEGAVPVCAAVLSFGGICVIMQVAAVSGGRIPLKQLLISRLPAAALSAVFSLPAVLLPVPAQEVYSANAVQPELFSVNAGMSVCVMLMAGILIHTMGSRNSGGK